MSKEIDSVLEREYVSGQYSDSFPELLQEYEQQSSEIALHSANSNLDRPYGLAAREVYDFFPAKKPADATLIYFHAGYWQSRDKSMFRFIARSLNLAGINVALVNYPLCPDISIAQIIIAARKAICAILNETSTNGKTPPLILSGHSAGAHIAIEMALSQWDEYNQCDISGVLAISGIYDLHPLIATSLNTALGLDHEEALRVSPLFRVKDTKIPAIFAVGELETSEFRRQSTQMADRWLSAGNSSSLIILPNDDHFSVLRSLASIEGKLLESCRSFLK